MTFVILSGGFFLILLSLIVLNIALANVTRYRETVRETLGIQNPELLPAQVIMVSAWTLVLFGGCALVIWGVLR